MIWKQGNFKAYIQMILHQIEQEGKRVKSITWIKLLFGWWPLPACSDLQSCMEVCFLKYFLQLNYNVNQFSSMNYFSGMRRYPCMKISLAWNISLDLAETGPGENCTSSPSTCPFLWAVVPSFFVGAGAPSTIGREILTGPSKLCVRL